jgi:type II secretory pathway pseudopilin PulG
VEIAIVAIFLGILAGIALPNLTRAIHKADAAKIVNDVRAVELAVQTHIEDTGLLPRTGAWNTVPADLVPFVRDSMTFSYRHIDYRLVTNRNRGQVRFRVRYPRNDAIGQALKRFQRTGEVTWNNTQTVFILDPE